MSKNSNVQTTIRDVFRKIMLSCIQKIEKNIESINENAEFLHQIRVELRKLHTSMRLLAKLFPDISQSKQFANFTQAVRLYESNLNKARDWDVFSQINLPQTICQLEADRHYKSIQAQANTFCLQAHKQMITYITANTQLWSNLTNWLKPDSSISNGKSIAQINHILLKYKNKILRLKLPIGQISDNEQHKLRIFTKKYRYTLEFFAHLSKEKNAKAYIKKLKQLQSILGSIHDYVVMRELCNELLKQHTKNTHGYVLAIGKLIGASACEINHLQYKFDKKWHKYYGRLSNGMIK